MLKGIPKIISPELLKILCEMGHGDELVIADGNFPSQSLSNKVVRADGLGAAETLEAILQLVPLDSYSQPNFLLMQVVPGDDVVPTIWQKYESIAQKDKNFALGTLERFEFYNRAKAAYAIVATGEQALYANIIIKKGVIK